MLISSKHRNAFVATNEAVSFSVFTTTPSADQRSFTVAIRSMLNVFLLNGNGVTYLVVFRHEAKRQVLLAHTKTLSKSYENTLVDRSCGICRWHNATSHWTIEAVSSALTISLSQLLNVFDPVVCALWPTNAFDSSTRQRALQCSSF